MNDSYFYLFLAFFVLKIANMVKSEEKYYIAKGVLFVAAILLAVFAIYMNATIAMLSH